MIIPSRYKYTVRVSLQGKNRFFLTQFDVEYLLSILYSGSQLSWRARSRSPLTWVHVVAQVKRLSFPLHERTCPHWGSIGLLSSLCLISPHTQPFFLALVREIPIAELNIEVIRNSSVQNSIPLSRKVSRGVADL